VVPVEKCSHAPSIAVVLLLLLLVSPVLGAVVPGRFGVSAAAAAVNTVPSASQSPRGAASAAGYARGPARWLDSPFSDSVVAPGRAFRSVMGVPPIPIPFSTQVLHLEVVIDLDHCFFEKSAFVSFLSSHAEHARRKDDMKGESGALGDSKLDGCLDQQ
jgi:hypothetical protein